MIGRSRQAWRWVRRHPRAAVLGWPTVLILAAAGLTWLVLGHPFPPRTAVSNSSGTNAATVNLGPTTNQPSEVNPGWLERLGVGLERSVQVNALEFQPGEKVEAAIVNGTDEAIYFLQGCLLPTVEQKVADSYRPFPTAQAACAALPDCQPVEPQTVQRFMEWDQQIAKPDAEALVRESGTYRIPFAYGTACENGQLSGTATIVSEDITVK